MSGPRATSLIRRNLLLLLAGFARWTVILTILGSVGLAIYASNQPAPVQENPATARIGLVGQPLNRPSNPHIGIVAGHWGYDTGAICLDGLTEADVNLNIARRVIARLEARLFRVDLLQEFDPRLNGYAADALVSIHSDSCEYINDIATGFKIAHSIASYTPEAEDQLVDCIEEQYAAATQLPFHANSITPDMTSYHSFSEVEPDTPAAIIEIGFLYLDRALLTQQPDLVADGIAQGIFCFIEKSKQ